jgi:PII-like signaling protein
MKVEGEGQLLKVFIGGSDRWHGRPLYEAITLKAREMGLAGVTVIQGIMGFGADSRLHTAKVLRLSEDLPVVIEIVDKPDRIALFIPVLDKMVTEGMITLDPVHILAYRHNGTKPAGI